MGQPNKVQEVLWYALLLLNNFYTFGRETYYFTLFAQSETLTQKEFTALGKYFLISRQM